MTNIITIKVDKEIKITCDELSLLLNLTDCNKEYACDNYQLYDDLYRQCLDICDKLNKIYELFCKEESKEES